MGILEGCLESENPIMSQEYLRESQYFVASFLLLTKDKEPRIVFHGIGAISHNSYTLCVVGGSLTASIHCVVLIWELKWMEVDCVLSPKEESDQKDLV